MQCFEIFGGGIFPPWLRACRKCFLLKLALRIALRQEWATSGPRATNSRPQRFQWPAEAFTNNHQVRNNLQLIAVNVSVEANFNRNLLLFLLEKRLSI